MYPLGLTNCAECGHVQLGVVVDPAVLYGDYRYKSGVSSSFKEHLSGLAEEIGNAGFVLEIGSNDGTLLDYLAAKGNRVLGVDPASSCKTLPNIRAEFNLRFARDFYPFNGPVDVVVAVNVLAHIDDLRSVVRGVDVFLKDTGTFVFEVQYLHDLIEGRHWDMIYHEHLDYHHLKPLQKFLLSEGFHIHDVKHTANQGGSIRVYAKKTPSTFEVDEQPPDLAALVQAVQTVKNPLEGVRGVIAGYGAPAKATTFMYQTGARVDFIVDDTPEKQGLYTPGLNVPIISFDEFRTRKYDKIFPFAWNFASELRAKHPELNWVTA